MKILENKLSKYILYEREGIRMGRIESYRTCPQELARPCYWITFPKRYCYRAEFEVGGLWRCWFNDREIKVRD